MALFCAIQCCKYIFAISNTPQYTLTFLCINWVSHMGTNHNYNKIVKSDWLSTALISALIGQFNRTVRIMPK